MNALRKFGIGIVGVGNAAEPHVLALRDLADEVEVRGVVGRDPQRLGTFTARHNLPATESLDMLLADPAVDAVLIVTPPNARLPIVAAAAAAGKHIFMEKPVERTTEVAREIVSLCEAAGVRLGIVFQHRFRESSMKARELLESGALGAIAAVYLVLPWWRPQSYYDQPGRGTFARDGGGVLISQAIHPLDLMLSLAGPVAEVQAMVGTTILHRMETEDFATAGLHFVNGALGSLMATTASFPGDAEYMVFDCEKATARLAGGKLDVRWHDGRMESFGSEVSTGGGADPMAFPHDWHLAQWRDFLAAISRGREPQSNGRTALRVHSLIDALLASSANGVVTKVEQN
ncbi:MAG TPA: Gfo/Idh/MocA family oxidoreductase [Devosiaceae bacterium]|jgi:predicted dehydrogenase